MTGLFLSGAGGSLLPSVDTRQKEDCGLTGCSETRDRTQNIQCHLLQIISEGTSVISAEGLLKNVLQRVALGVSTRRLYGFALLPDRERLSQKSFRGRPGETTAHGNGWQVQTRLDPKKSPPNKFAGKSVFRASLEEPA